MPFRWLQHTCPPSAVLPRRLQAAGLALLLAFAFAATSAAQPSLTSEERPVRVGLTPVVQGYTFGEQTSTQQSVVLDVLVPVSPRWQIQASGRVAQSSLDGGTDVTGLDDAQVGVLYAQPVGDGSLVGRLDVSVPVGKQELTVPELRTVRAVSNGVFDYRVPGYGTGFSVAPRVTYAVPLTDRVAAGIGAAFRYAGSYRPLLNMERSYEPGNGVEGFAGLEVSVTEQVSLAVDARAVQYGTDRLGGVRRLDPGRLYSGTLQGSYVRGFQEVTASVTYRYRTESDLFESNPFSDVRVPTERQLTPSESRVRVAYRTRVVQGWRVGVSAGRFQYVSTDFIGGQRVYRAGLHTSIDVFDGLAIAPRGAYTFGDFSGYTASLRTEYRF